MKLTPRLQAIADGIDECKVLADVGTDHAHLPIYLTLNHKAERAIASDINKGPIEIAESRIKQFELQDKIETRLGGGLTILKPKEADTIVIAGMGGMLIVDIIHESMEVAKGADMLVLQPMLHAGKLRSYLMENGFEIYDEELAKEERKLYEIIWTRYTGVKGYPEGSMDIGPKLIEKKHPLLIELLERKISEQEGIIEKLEQNSSESTQKRIQECKELLSNYFEVKKWV